MKWIFLIIWTEFKKRWNPSENEDEKKKKVEFEDEKMKWIDKVYTE